jgi:hypothetical protein
MQMPTTHKRPTTTKASLKICSSRSIRNPEQENRDGNRRQQQEPSNQSNKKHSSPTTLVDTQQLTLFIYKNGLSSLKLFCKFHNKMVCKNLSNLLQVSQDLQLQIPNKNNNN